MAMTIFLSIDRLMPLGFVSYWGLYDGASLQIIWQKASITSGTGHPLGPYSGILQDLNGDGLLDYLVAIPQLNQVTWVQTHSYISQSGPDGTVIWREDGPRQVGAFYALTEDLNGDGIPDPIFLEYEGSISQLRALDSTDGHELWATPLASLEAQYSGSTLTSLVSASWRGFQSNLDHPDLKEYVVHHGVLPAYGSGLPAFLAFAHYDAYDGTFLGSFPTPTTLEPWSPDTSYATDTRGPFYIGDIDQDSLEEIGIPFDDWQRSPDWATQGTNPHPSTQFAIVGMRTLFVADTYQLGLGILNFDLAIPAGVNKDYVILLSTAFDAKGGLQLGPWKTYLGPSSVMNYSLAHQNMSGTLDSNGKASTFVWIPAHPSLLGQTLYSKALVLNPAGNPEPIQTMSSMGITALQ